MDITDKANLYLFGVSDSGKVIKDILHASCRKMEAYVDDNKSVYTCYGRPVLHDASSLSPVIVSTGVNKIRKIIVVLLVVSNPAVLSAIAILLCSIVSPSTMIGEGRVVTAGAIIDTDGVIGKHCIINMGATIDQDGVNEDYCYIAHPCKVLREN